MKTNMQENLLILNELIIREDYEDEDEDEEVKFQTTEREDTKFKQQTINQQSIGGGEEKEIDSKDQEEESKFFY
jgi:hypothetical protein